jgi:hypothetical protein
MQESHIVRWTLIEEQLMKINKLGIKDNPHAIKINAHIYGPKEHGFILIDNFK